MGSIFVLGDKIEETAGGFFNISRVRNQAKANRVLTVSRMQFLAMWVVGKPGFSPRKFMVTGSCKIKSDL